MKISNIAKIINTKIYGSFLDKTTYISTENMLPNCGGVVDATTVPNAKVTSFNLDDTLLSNIRPYFKKVWFARFNGGCSNDVICLRADASKCLPKYLYYALSTDKFIDIFSASSKGTKMPRGDKNALLDYNIPDKTIEEQLYIVDILGSIDEKVENNNKKIENLLSLGQLKYQEDILNNDYEHIELSKLVRISRGASPRPIQNYLTATGHSWVKISDVTSLSTPFLFETKEYITDDGTNHSVAVYPNDLILSNSATPGIPVFMEIEAFIHDGWLIIRDFNKITPNYLFWVLKSDRDIILTQGNGSIFTNLKTDILKAHKIPVPSKEKMEKLDNLYSNILLKIKHTTKENIKLNELKQLYLKKFFG